MNQALSASHLRDVLCIRLDEFVEHERTVTTAHVHAIERQEMPVHVQSKGPKRRPGLAAGTESWTVTAIDGSE